MGVVKHDDGAIAREALHIVNHLLWGNHSGIIATYHVVHHYIVVQLEGLHLSPTQSAVGGAEEGGAQQEIGLGNVAQVVDAGVFAAVQMVHGVVAYCVAALVHFFDQFGVSFGILSHHEEGGLYAIAIQNVEHLRSNLRHRAIVECEICTLSPAHLDAPNGLRVEQAKSEWWLHHKVEKFAVTHLFLRGNVGGEVDAFVGFHLVEQLQEGFLSGGIVVAQEEI